MIRRRVEARVRGGAEPAGTRTAADSPARWSGLQDDEKPRTLPAPGSAPPSDFHTTAKPVLNLRAPSHPFTKGAGGFGLLAGLFVRKERNRHAPYRKYSGLLPRNIESSPGRKG